MSKTESPKIIFVEDDPDQLDLLLQFALDEISKLHDGENTNAEQKQMLSNIKLLKVTNLRSLQQAVSKYQDVFLTVLDCNIPDVKGGISNDQLMKTNHRINGRHQGVEIVIESLPDTPITLISSLDRFKRIVYAHYASDDKIDITFICLLYTSPSPRDLSTSRMPSSA